MLPELAADRVTIAADKGRARGLELSFGYNRDDRFVAWASYTLGKAEDYLEGRWEPRSWDQRHTLSTGLIARPGKWELSLSLLAHSGWPTTRIPAVLEEDQDLIVQRNAGRLKNYFSLDLRAARRWERGRHRLLVFVEVTNASARKNVGSTEIDIEEDEESGQLFLETTQEPVFPWIPSIGLQWTF